MYIEIIKDHPVGLKAGMCTITDAAHGKKWEDAGYSKEIDESTYKAWANLFNKTGVSVKPQAKKVRKSDNA